MSEQMWQRTHTCGDLRASDHGKKTILMGWVAGRRDHGGIIFIDLRDRYGRTQIVFNPENPEVYEAARSLRGEYVVAVAGIVQKRPENLQNPKIATGEIEVIARELQILNPAATPPFEIEDDVNATEELRLKYRYLDLRRGEMQRNLLLRHRLYQVVRNHLDQEGFVEVETPLLMRSTPEGARDFLVPSRLNRGKFYALPQSPQTYKQILMIAGFDKYFQIVKCFRDEDLRADRQPEFTQIDIEMSFVSRDDVLQMTERLMQRVMRDIAGLEISLPLPRLTYEEAMATYGTDKPDLRFGMRLVDISELVATSDFRVFADCVKGGGRVKGICAPGCAAYSRKQIDALTELAKKRGARGMVAIKIGANDWDSNLAKYFSPEARAQIAEKFGAAENDLLIILADQADLVNEVLGVLRVQIAKQENLIDTSRYELVWVVEFPLLEFDEEEKRYVARHHPFTSPMEEDMAMLETDPGKVRARAYDLVLNGHEIAGGSIRIHKRELQNRMFSLLNIGPEEAEAKFGFLLQAFDYGAPPHGGIAFGFDRLAMILAGKRSIREVIAFPKTNSGLSLMDGSPSEVHPAQLKELGIKLEPA